MILYSKKNILLPISEIGQNYKNFGQNSIEVGMEVGRENQFGFLEFLEFGQVAWPGSI